MENQDILDDHYWEFKGFINEMISDKIHNLGYTLNYEQCEDLRDFLDDDILEKEISQTGILREFRNISDNYAEIFRNTNRFNLDINRLRDEGYHPKLFDSKYIDFIAFEGKLEDADLECTFEIEEPPEDLKDCKDYAKYTKMFWKNRIYTRVYKNGECIAILNSGNIDSKLLQVLPWMENISFILMNENDVNDFFSRNKDVPVKYKF